MRISDSSSYVCSSDLRIGRLHQPLPRRPRARLIEHADRHALGPAPAIGRPPRDRAGEQGVEEQPQRHTTNTGDIQPAVLLVAAPRRCKPAANLARGLVQPRARFRSEEHTSELHSLMRTSYAVFCLTQKKT